MQKFADLFRRTTKAVVKYIGSKPFHIIRGLNAAVFDSVFTAFARHVDELNTDTLLLKKIKHLHTQYKKLLSDAEYLDWISSATTDEDIVPKRLKKAEKYLFN